MKKKPKKLALHRETLLYLDLRSAVGGYEPSERTVCETFCVSNCSGCVGEGGGDSYGSCGNTACLCSGGCATGGACTVSC